MIVKATNTVILFQKTKFLGMKHPLMERQLRISIEGKQLFQAIKSGTIWLISLTLAQIKLRFAYFKMVTLQIKWWKLPVQQTGNTRLLI